MVKEIGFCEDCKSFRIHKTDYTKHKVGTCELEPFDVGNMKENHMAIICGHDGPIFVGSKFGCVNFERKEDEEK